MPGLRDMVGTVTVGLFYRQLVSRVRTTAGQDASQREQSRERRSDARGTPAEAKVKMKRGGP